VPRRASLAGPDASLDFRDEFGQGGCAAVADAVGARLREELAAGAEYGDAAIARALARLMPHLLAAERQRVADAQARGYAEADPTFDIEGVDAAHKLTILAALASFWKGCNGRIMSVCMITLINICSEVQTHW